MALTRDQENVIEAKLRAQTQWNEMTEQQRQATRLLLDRWPSIIKAAWIAPNSKGRNEVRWVMS